MNLKDKKLLIWDLMVCTDFAMRMARDFGTTWYHPQWNRDNAKINEVMVGEGLDGVTRVKDFWQHVDQADLICVFCNNGQDVVEYLRSKGKRVFGAGKAEELEANRWKGRQVQKTVGLPTQTTVMVKGMTNLDAHLKTAKDKFVKLNYYRGAIETFHHKDYSSTKPLLDYLNYTLGALKDEVVFIVEDPVEGTESGSDTFVVDGQYPNKCMMGWETKNKSYIAKVVEYAKLPQPIKEVNDKMAPVFKKLKARTMYSTEVRITDKGKGYLIDNTIRRPFPPSAIMMEIFDNFSEFIWNAAEGKCVDLTNKYAYGCEIILHSPWAVENVVEICFPENMKQWVKLSTACKVKGKYYNLPGVVEGDGTICSCVGLGNTPEEAIDKAEKVMESVEAYQVDKTFDKKAVLDKIKEGKKININF